MSFRLAGSITIAVVALSVPVRARATTTTFPNFATTTGLTLSGNAAAVTTVDGPVLRLTPAQKSQRGSVFSSVTVDPTRFSTAFAFKMSAPGGVTDPDSGKGGDGLVFAIQSPSASLGDSGGGLGIEGVKPSVAVEFDTWNNRVPSYPAIADPSANHIGVDVNGNVKSVITAEVTPAMNNGHVWYVWIDYDGTTLSVRLGESNVRPVAASLSYAIDIPAVLGVAQAYVGMSAATAAAWQNHDILRWTYDDSFVDGGVGPDSSVGVNPEGGSDDADAGQADADAAVASDGAVPADDAQPQDGGADGPDEADASAGDGSLGDDASVADADGGADASVDGAGGKGYAVSGCSCDVTSRSSGGGAWALLGLTVLLSRSRRQRARANHLRS